MEIQEEAMAGTTTTPNSSSSVDNEHTNAIIKGKRTKRRRLRQYLPTRPVAAAAVTPSTSSYSGEVSDSTIDEEEDMANCLILLAQGRALEAKPKSGARLELGEGGGARGERYTSRRLAEAATMANGKVSYYVYECKTCNKCFPSFQALGGHRSSHKKLKMAAAAAMALEEKTTTREQVSLQIGITSSHLNSNDLLPHSNSCTTSPALHKNNNNITSSSNKQKVHECSICGSEFSSGQALGGHMRRHRADQVILPGVPQEVKEKSGLALDLNLPAPAEDDRGASPSFFARKRPLVFSSSALVDCHY